MIKISAKSQKTLEDNCDQAHGIFHFWTATPAMRVHHKRRKSKGKSYEPAYSPFPFSLHLLLISRVLVKPVAVKICKARDGRIQDGYISERPRHLLPFLPQANHGSVTSRGLFDLIHLLHFYRSLESCREQPLQNTVNV